MAISWTPCDCPAPTATSPPDHVRVHCRQRGCTETWQTDTVTLFGHPGDRRGAADRGQVHAMGVLDTAWIVLMKAHEHYMVLREPAHPRPRRIAELRSWIQNCVVAIDEAQRSTTLLAQSSEIAQVEEISEKIGAVVDTFQVYASMLERFRGADEVAEAAAPPTAQSGSLAGIAADERVVLSCRSAMRNSMQQLIAALDADR
jgi:hypothetical protein